MNLIIKAKYIADPEQVIEDGCIVVEGDEIIDVGGRGEILGKYSSSGYEVIDASGKLVIPGLVNSHTHISMTLLRGYADDIPLQEWLNKWIWPYEARMNEHDIELGAMLGAVESIMSGVTTVCTMYHYHPEHNEASACLKIGLRCILGIAMFSWDEEGSIKNVLDGLNRWHNKGDGLIKISISPHAPYTVSPELYRRAEEIRREASIKYGDEITITSHVLEDWNEPKLIREKFNVELPSNSVMKYLESLGVLSRNFIVAHGIYMGDIDLEVAVRNNVGIVHNPVANLKLGMGIADIPRMLKNGLRIGLGTDGPSSNNTLDMFETMKYASLIHKGIYRDPSIVPAGIVFKMATLNGGSLFNINIGRIKPGFKADLVVINIDNPRLTPIYNVYSHLVYAMDSSCIDTVIINGRIIYENGVFKNINIEDLLYRVRRRAYELRDEVMEGAEHS